MPMPTPNKGESQKDFISRCMGNPTMVKDYKKQNQRAAICYSQWAKKSTKQEALASNYSLNGACVSGAKSKIGSGNVDRTSGWSKPTLGDFGGNVAALAKMSLGKTNGGDPKVASTWHYQIGKGSKIYRSGVIAAKRRASGQNQTNIGNAAARLLSMIDKNKEE